MPGGKCEACDTEVGEIYRIDSGQLVCSSCRRQLEPPPPPPEPPPPLELPDYYEPQAQKGAEAEGDQVELLDVQDVPRMALGCGFMLVIVGGIVLFAGMSEYQRNAEYMVGVLGGIAVVLGGVLMWLLYAAFSILHELRKFNDRAEQSRDADKKQ